MILPDYYEFCCRVKIVAGHDALEKIPALLAETAAEKEIFEARKAKYLELKQAREGKDT